MHRLIELTKTNSSRTTSQVTRPDDNKAIGTCFALIADLRPAALILARRIAIPLLLLSAGMMVVQPCAGQSGTWTETGVLAQARALHTATLLPNGKVLVAAGSNFTGVRSPRILPQPKLPSVVLYDQYDNDRDSGVGSQDRPDAPPLSAEVADNFVVPAGQTWNITEVDIRSSVGEPAPTSFAVHFYTDARGLPGTEVYVATGLAVVGDPDYIVTLTTPASLSEGTYWVSVVGTITGTGWYWRGRLKTSNRFATAWRNPGNGFNTGCRDWAQFQDCVGVSWPDQMFRIVGTTGGGELTLVSAASVKGPFAIDLPLTGTSGVEDRSGGPNKKFYVAMTFDNNITSVGSATTTCGGVSTWSISGPTVTFKLVGVAHGCNESDITITANDVMDDMDNTLSSASVAMGLLLGDVNGDRVVDGTDYSIVRSYRGQHTDGTNYRSDVSNDGFINASDARLVNQQQGTSLP